MSMVFNRLDALAAPLFLLFVLGMVAVIFLADRILSALTIRRHKYDGLQDPRVLRPNRRRSLALRRQTGVVNGEDPAEGY